MINRALIIPRHEKTWLTRQERIKREGSEYFTWPVPAVAASGIGSIEIAHQFPRAKKYEPLDWIEIVNNDTVDVRLIINNDMTLPVLAGTIRTVDNAALWTIGIENLSATTAVTLLRIIVSLRRQPLTIDQWARRGA